MDGHDKYVLDEEQIKRIVDNKLAEHHQNNSIESIVLNSTYKVLFFEGTADFSFMTRNVPIQEIQSRRILIKSIKTYIYASVQTDELFNATSGDHYTVPSGGKLNKIEDAFQRAGKLELIINGATLRIFPEDIVGTAANGIPPDIFVDNIYYNYKAKIDNLQCRADYLLITDMNTGAVNVNPPFIRVMIECYLY